MLSENTFATTVVVDNSTSRPNNTADDILTVYDYYFFISLWTISTIGVTGNALVIHVMRKNKRLRRPSNYFIFSLAMSDLLLGILYPIYILSHLKVSVIEETLAGWTSCEFILTTTLGLQIISTYNLVGITIVRYFSIRDPLRFPIRFTRRCALDAVVAIWVLLGLTACAFFLRKRPPEYKNECRYEKVFDEDEVMKTMFFYVLLPLVLMASLYTRMAIIARKQIEAVFTQQVDYGSQYLTVEKAAIKRELRMFKMAGLLLGYFAFAWVPFAALEFCLVIKHMHINKWIVATVRIILHSNSAVNVVIYAGGLRSFQEAIKANFSWCCCSDSYKF